MTVDYDYRTACEEGIVCEFIINEISLAGQDCLNAGCSLGDLMMAAIKAIVETASTCPNPDKGECVDDVRFFAGACMKKEDDVISSCNPYCCKKIYEYCQDENGKSTLTETYSESPIVNCESNLGPLDPVSSLSSTYQKSCEWLPSGTIEWSGTEQPGGEDLGLNGSLEE